MAGGTSRSEGGNAPFHLDRDGIRADLTTERPIWTLSCYGPGRNAPRQLFGGLPREQSFEEMRLRHYQLAAQGREAEAVTEAQTLVHSSEQQMEAVLKDLDGAIDYITSGEASHPNRIDICANRVSQLQNGTSIPADFGQLQTSTHDSEANVEAQASSSNPFARTAAAMQARSSPAGAPSAPSANPFAGTVAAREAAQTVPPRPQQTTAMFGHAAREPLTSTAQNAGRFVSNGNGDTSIRRDRNGHLTSWRGHAVSYIDDKPCVKRQDGAWERVWFPETPKWLKESDLPMQGYDANLEASYATIRREGMEPTLLMPSLPPKREWCQWDF